MGTVALVALGDDGRQRGAAGLGAAVLVLVLVDPGLAVSAGFALSVLATAGILVLGAGHARRAGPVAAALAGRGDRGAGSRAAGLHPGGRGDLRSGEPGRGRWPTCWWRRPSGRRRCSGWPAGCSTLVWAPLGRLSGTAGVAGASPGSSSSPSTAPRCRPPRSGWGTGPVALAVLTVVVGLVALLGPRLLRRPVTGVGCCLVLVVGGAGAAAGLGLAAGRLGAGRLRRGPGRRPGAAARGRARRSWSTPGPDPAAVGPLPRPARRRRGARCWCSPTSTPTTSTGSTGCSTDARVGASRPPGCWTRRGGSPRCADDRAVGGPGAARRRRTATTRRTAPLTLQVLWPPPDSPTRGPGDGSTANDASVVLLAEAGGLRILLTGDVEPTAQAAPGPAAAGPARSTC